MPGTFSPPPRVSDPDMHHGTCVTQVPWCMAGSLISGFLWSWWQGKRSRHSRRMRNRQFYVSSKRPMGSPIGPQKRSLPYVLGHRSTMQSNKAREYVYCWNDALSWRKTILKTEALSTHSNESAGKLMIMPYVLWTVHDIGLSFIVVILPLLFEACDLFTNILFFAGSGTIELSNRCWYG